MSSTNLVLRRPDLAYELTQTQLPEESSVYERDVDQQPQRGVPGTGNGYHVAADNLHDATRHSHGLPDEGRRKLLDEHRLPGLQHGQ